MYLIIYDDEMLQYIKRPQQTAYQFPFTKIQTPVWQFTVTNI